MVIFLDATFCRTVKLTKTIISFCLFDPTPQKVSARAVIFGAKRRDFGSLNIAALFYGLGAVIIVWGLAFFCGKLK